MQETWRLRYCHTFSIYLRYVVELVTVFSWGVRYRFGIQLCVAFTLEMERNMWENNFPVCWCVHGIWTTETYFQNTNRVLLSVVLRLKQSETCSVKQNLKFHFVFMEISTSYLHLGEVEISASTSRISSCALNEIVNFSKLWQKDEHNKRLGISLELSSGGPWFLFGSQSKSCVCVQNHFTCCKQTKTLIPSRGFCLSCIVKINLIFVRGGFPPLALQL